MAWTASSETALPQLFEAPLRSATPAYTTLTYSAPCAVSSCTRPKAASSLAALPPMERGVPAFRSPLMLAQSGLTGMEAVML